MPLANEEEQKNYSHDKIVDLEGEGLDMSRNLNVIYRIDESDRIVYVNDEWDIFAVENDAKELISENVKNKNLWEYIQGEELVYLYGIIFEKVRRRRIELSFQYRCDSPGKRRYLEMNVAPLKGQMVEIRNPIVKIENRESIDILRNEVKAGDKFIIMCSWCKKVKAEDWVEVEDAIKKYGLFEKDSLPQITHSICKVCTEKLYMTLKGSDKQPHSYKAPVFKR